jgi:hypothetical protein
MKYPEIFTTGEFNCQGTGDESFFGLLLYPSELHTDCSAWLDSNQRLTGDVSLIFTTGKQLAIKRTELPGNNR